MRGDMLRSQFDALEEPLYGLALDVLQPPQALIARIRAALEI